MDAQWKNLFGSAFYQTLNGTPVRYNASKPMDHVHPNVDSKPEPAPDPAQTKKVPLTTSPEEEYEAHKKCLESKISARSHSDYAKVMSVAESLKDHISDEAERLRVAAAVTKKAAGDLTSIDVVKSIDQHLSDIEVHHRLVAMDSPKTLLEQRIENLKSEKADTLNKVEEATASIAEMQAKIESTKEQIEHDKALAERLDEDIREAATQLKESPLDKAVHEVRAELIKAKKILGGDA